MNDWILTSGAVALCSLGLALSAPAAGQDGAPEGIPAQVRERFKALDANRDGKLQASEVADAPAFARGDLNGDGALSPLEAYRLYLIQQGKGLGATQKLVEGFEQADEDRSGFLELAEFPREAGTFRAMDRDQDGKLTLEEAVRYQVADEMAGFLLDEDLDGDGKLSRDELPASSRPFVPLADADGDGKLNEQELYRLVLEFRLALLSARAAKSAESPAPPAAPAPPARAAERAPSSEDVLTRLQGKLSELDANRDGRLEASEVLLSRALLESLDRDGDRALDAAELRLAIGRRDRIVKRARALGKQLNAEPAYARQLVAVEPELRGLLAAGRLAAAERLVDEVELLLLRDAGK